MFKTFKSGASESESAALSVSNIDDDVQNDVDVLSNDINQPKPNEKKSTKILRSLSSNLKEKLQKKTFHRIDIDDQGSDSQHSLEKASGSDLQANDIEFTQLNNMNDLPFNSLMNDDDTDEDNDEDTDISQISHDDGHDHNGEHDDYTSNHYTFCISLKSMICHLLTMIFVSLTQVMVCAALYIIVPLHVKYTLEGGEILTGLIFLNYGFAYLAFHIFACMCCNFYGSAFTLLVGIILCSISLLFMVIFTDYFVWLMMMFVQGISFALFTIGSQNFIIDNICIKSRKSFENVIVAFRKLAMLFGFMFAASAIHNVSILFATGVTFGVSLSGIILLCLLSIPPKYNDNCLVTNTGNENRVITKASLTAWRSSLKQLSFKQRFSIFSWIKKEQKQQKVENDTPIYALDDELNMFQVFSNNISTIMSICVFSFGLTFVRCCRLLIITFKCMQIEGFTAVDIGYINGISFVAELLLYNISWYILYSFGRRYTLITSHLIFIIALFNVPYCNNVHSLSFISVLFGIANGSSHGLIHKVAIDVAPTEYRDKFLTIYQTLTNLAYIIAPIFVALLVQIASILTACVCSAMIVILSLFWSWCIMTDPKKTGKRYEQLDLEKSYVGNNDEASLQHDGILIDGKHKMELHSIDSVMERDESTHANDVVVKKEDMLHLFGDNQDEKEEEEEHNAEIAENDDENDKNNDDYASRIAHKSIGNIQLGLELNKYAEQNQLQYKFEIGHFDEEEEESINYQLSSTDND